MAETRADVPVERRSYGKYYLIFSILLIGGTLWAVIDQLFLKAPWKEYQKHYYELATVRLDSLRNAALAQVDSSQIGPLKDALDSAQAGMNSADYKQAVDRKDALERQLEAVTTDWRFSRSRSDAAYYQYQKAMLEEGREDPSLKKAVSEQDSNAARYFRKMGDINAEIAVCDETINRYKDALAKAQKDYDNLFANANSYEDKAERIESAPLQIQQVVLNDFQHTPFQEVKPRVDRCQTCHMGWNDKTMADAPEPFAEHPFPELLKIHNPETFGCTPCHRGQGPALSAGYAHGDADPDWPTPILRGQDVYASCNSCHSTETVLKSAEPFTRAMQIVAESGCFGCHDMTGFSGCSKIGPSLNDMPAKVNPAWVFQWVKNPKVYTPHTRMPDFELTDEQAEDVTACLMSIGKESNFKPMSPRGAYVGGSAVAGKALFESVGCQDCHVVGTMTKVRDARGTSYDIAPELSKVGSKVNPDWLYDWVRNPRHYDPQTRMPNLRLTDQEAKNVVAYLMTLKDTTVERTPSFDLNDPKKIAAGATVIREFGCFGCHDIKGMEKEGKVSVDLSDFDRKLLDQMDFGDTRELPENFPVDFKADSAGGTWVKHSWAAWVYAKLHNSRVFQTERIVQRMPVFSFNDQEIKLIRLFLISMTKDAPTREYQMPDDSRLQDIAAGRRVVRDYNCIQCHQIEGVGGYILATYDDPSLGPPVLTASEGAKVQEQWLYNFLKNPTTIRPWLKIRMPTFDLTDQEISKITKYFLALSDKQFVLRDYSAIPADQKYLAPGKKLYDSYQCGKCHPSGPVTLGGEVSAASLAPNLVQAHKRLKPEWINDWLHDPQKLQPGTRMPSFFYEGKGPEQTVFGGDEEQQIKALEAYVWNLGRRSNVLSATR